MMRERGPIFLDERQRRWRRTRRVLEAAGGLFAVLLVTFVVTVAKQVDLPTLLLPESKPGLHPVRQRPPTKTHSRAGRRRRVAALGTVPVS